MTFGWLIERAYPASTQAPNDAIGAAGGGVSSRIRADLIAAPLPDTSTGFKSTSAISGCSSTIALTASRTSSTAGTSAGGRPP